MNFYDLSHWISYLEISQSNTLFRPVRHYSYVKTLVDLLVLFSRYISFLTYTPHKGFITAVLRCACYYSLFGR